MLTALEKGQNEFIEAVRPKSLIYFTEQHKLGKQHPDNGKIYLANLVVNTKRIYIKL